MKKRISTWVMALMAVAFSSCLNLGDDTEYVRDWDCMATVTTGGVNPVFQKDEGTFLVPDAAMPADTFTVGERYYIHFIYGDTTNHAQGTYSVNLWGYAKTTNKALVVLPVDSTDRWENQPIHVTKIWYSGHYCNFLFSSFIGLSSPNTFELVRILDNESTTPTDTVPELFLELRHNVKNYSSSYFTYRFYSFDLSSLKTDFPLATKFHIQISWNEVDFGKKTYPDYYIPDQSL